MYILELDMDRPGMANDWSFTAWGENAEVEITVVGRLSETQHLPYIEKNDDLLPSNEGGATGGNNGSE